MVEQKTRHHALRKLRCLMTGITGVLFFSCATGITGPAAAVPAPPDERGAFSRSSPLQQDLVASAHWALGRKRLDVRGKRFNQDCTGVVLAIYYKSGIDLTAGMSRYSGGGVQRLHQYMTEQELLYRSDFPAPGDLLFWDDTYDRNGDGRINDELTHIGMVTAVDREGNVEYIHHNYRRGIVLASMNLLHPDDRERNSPMRARDAEKGHAPRWLSSHLLREAGKAYALLDGQ